MTVNEEWNCDKGGFGFRYVESDARLSTPLVRVGGELRPASWDEALVAAAAGLKASQGKTATITGGRLMVEDAYASSSSSVEFSAATTSTSDPRVLRPEEEQFLAARVAGRGLGPTYADLENAPAVLLVAFEPEDESPIVLLRLRKASRSGTQVLSVAPAASRGLAKTDGTWIPAAPGREAEVVEGLDAATREALAQSGSVILVGQRAASSAGLLSAVSRLADATGAALGWVPRRAGDRGAVEAGLLPTLLPGGRPVSDAAARVDTAAIWGVADIPEAPGRDTASMFEAIGAGDVSALLMGGVRLDDLPDGAEAAVRAAGFVVVLDTHAHEVTELADVVFPVAAAPEKAGSFVNWEGCAERHSSQVLKTPLMRDARVLAVLAAELGVGGLLSEASALHAELAEFVSWEGARTASPEVASGAVEAGPGLLLATWRPLLEPTVLQSGEPYLAATARPQEVWLSSAAAAALGAVEGQMITVSGASGSVAAPLVVTEVADGTVVVTGDAHRVLGASGTRVQLAGEGQ